MASWEISFNERLNGKHIYAGIFHPV